MPTNSPPITTISLIRCPGCTEPALRALLRVQSIGTRNGTLTGCTRCGWRGLLRIRQGLASLQVEFQALERVDLKAPPPAKPQPVDVVPGFREFFQG